MNVHLYKKSAVTVKLLVVVFKTVIHSSTHYSYFHDLY